MSQNPFELRLNPYFRLRKPRKRKPLTSSERIFIWEHPKKYGRKCHICSERITRLSELELDHKRAFSKGGTKLALAHKICNRMKDRKRLSQVQSRMGLKKVKKRKVKRKSSKGSFSNPITGKKERIQPLFKF